jgi:hypothetical protein
MFLQAICICQHKFLNYLHITLQTLDKADMCKLKYGDDNPLPALIRY